MDRNELKAKLVETKNKVKEKAGEALTMAKDGVKYCVKHKDVVIPLAVGVGTAVGGVGKFLGGLEKRKAVKEEIKRQERMIYNHSTGHYVELKRPLSAKQTLELERRRSYGEPLSVILDDMRLLKK